MAAATSSPVLSNNGSETSGNTTNSTPPPSSATPNLPTITLQRPDPPKNLRGLNKPKCIKCGNVARSRCPYQSCKSCCAKAQNPCHIHVLKANSTLADRGASSNSVPEQQPNEATSSGPQSKASSLRQLSSNFSQFNNVQTPLRSRKPLTRKEALTINEWRFAKLKEYREGNIEAENEAFDRYMHNISLLEEVFDVKSERPDENSSMMVLNFPTTSGEKMELVSETKLMLRSNPLRNDTFRKRIRETIDEGLEKLQTCNVIDDPSSLENGDTAPKAAKNLWAEKTAAWTDLNLKLNRARNEEDLKLCIQTRSNIRGQQKLSSGKQTEKSQVLEKHTSQNDFSLTQESDVSLKLVKTNEVDQDALNSMDLHFSSLEEIEDL